MEVIFSIPVSRGTYRFSFRYKQLYQLQTTIEVEFDENVVKLRQIQNLENNCSIQLRVTEPQEMQLHFPEYWGVPIQYGHLFESY